MRTRTIDRLLAGPWPLAAAMLLGLALRLANLQAEPYWGDELLSWDVVRHFWNAPLAMLEYLKQVEIHPPLYYLFLRGWLALSGSTELAVRLPSAVFGTLTIAAAWKFALALYADRKTAIAAAFLVALLPFQIEFGQEARPYAMAAFFSLVGAWALWLHVRDGRFRTAAAYALAQAAAILLHYAAILPLVVMAAWWLFRVVRADGRAQPRLLASWLTAHAAIFFAFWWWLDAFFFKWFYASMSIPGLPNRSNTGLVPIDFLEKIANQLVWPSKEKVLPKIEVLAAGLFKGLAAWFGLGLIRRGRALSEGTEYLLWLTAGTLLLYLLSPQSFEYAPFSERQALFASLTIGLLLARLIAALPDRQAALLAAVLLCTLVPRIVYIVDNDGKTDRYHQIRAAAEEVNAGYEPGDLVLIWQTVSRSNFNHYLRPDIEAVPILPAAYDRGGDGWSSRETLGFVENEAQLRIGQPKLDAMIAKLDRLIREKGARRVWLFGNWSDLDAHNQYFVANGWRPAVNAIQPIFPLSLYVKN